MTSKEMSVPSLSKATRSIPSRAWWSVMDLPDMRRPAGGPAGRQVRVVGRSGCGDPGLPDVGMLVDPLLRGIGVRHLLVRDEVGDLVLVLVAPLEVLDERRGRAGAVRPLGPHDLVQ